MSDAGADARARRAALCSLEAVRDRCARLLARARAGELAHFELVEAGFSKALGEISHAAMELSRSEATSFGRLRHFDAGGVPRSAALAERLAGRGAIERARSYVDLLVPSVLLDAGAGPSWSYVDVDGVELRRSEGLAVASLRMFEAGSFGGAPSAPRCDAEGLERLGEEALARALQVRPGHELVGLEGRARTLKRLAAILRAHPALFGPGARAGALVDAAREAARGGALEASRLFVWLAQALAPLWPEGAQLGGEPLGDVWRHQALGEGDEGLVPLHKLVQWLLRSLVEPLAMAGVELVGLDRLTPLADYRNAGLLLDVGALRLCDASEASATHAVSSELVVEWRALSVAILAELYARLGSGVGDPGQRSGLFDTASWLAGRTIASRLREGAPPPILVESDGTVF